MNFYAKFFNELTTSELYEILKSRSEIFFLEQHIICQDMDDIDYTSLHCFLTQDNRAAAYLRAFYDVNDSNCVKIGRVLTLKHGMGIGRNLLEQSIEAIKLKMNCNRICMDAQITAVGFYEKFGFKVVSDEFLEEGIIHVIMNLDL